MIQFDNNYKLKSYDLSMFNEGHEFYIEGSRDESYSKKICTFLWRIQKDGRVVKQGYIYFTGDDFLEMYNNHYSTHQERTEYIAELMNYGGAFRQEELI